MVSSVLSIKIAREIKTNYKQYLSVIIIATLAVTLFTGIWANFANFRERLDYIYTASNMCDAIITTSSHDDDIATYLNDKGVYYEERIFTTAKVGSESVFVSIFDDEMTLNTPYDSTIDQIDDYMVLTDPNFPLQQHINVGGSFPITINVDGIVLTLDFVLDGTMTHPESLENSKYTTSYIYIGKNALLNAISKLYPFLKTQLADKIDSSSNQFLIKCDDAVALIEDVNLVFKNNEKVIYALTRENLPTNLTIESDVLQAKQLIYIFPTIFYLVAVLIILTSISQLINREQKNIGIMKALGFKNGTITLHYTKIFIVLALIGSLLGIILGPIIIPNVMNIKYNILYQLPKIKLAFFRWEYLFSVIILILITIIVSVFSCYNTMKKPPAISLRGENSVKMRLSHLAKIKAISRLPLPLKMAVRNMKRKLSRTIMVITGVLGCSALLVCGFGIEDTINYGVDLEMQLIPYSISTTYSQGISLKTQIEEIEHVDICEEYAKYSISVKKDKLISSYVYILPQTTTIFQPDYTDSGCIISSNVASEIGCKKGDEITFIYNDKTYYAVVNDIVDFCISQGIFVSVNAFDLPFTPTGAWIRTDDEKFNEVVADEINQMESVYSASSIATFREMANTMTSTISIMTRTIRVFAILLAVVVLYNLALLNFKERTKDIATLKVLGFSRIEIGSSFIIEILCLTLLGSIVGLFFGKPLMIAVLSINETPLLSYIYHINPLSFVLTVAITCGSNLIINIIFAMLTNRVKMVESLKSVE